MSSHDEQLGPGPRGVTLERSRWLRFLTLCALYFAQGLPWGFVSIALIATLNEGGVTQQETGKLLMLATIPWTFKIIWGPVIDSFRLRSYGQRRPWIVLAQFGMAGTLLIAFSTADVTAESTLGTLGIIFFTHNCFASLQDVATDALAIDLLDDTERARVNGFMWGAKLLGVSIGGGGMAIVIDAWNLERGMQIMAGCVLAIMLLPLLIPERPGDRRFPWSRVTPAAQRHEAAVRTNPLRVIRELFRAFSTRTTLLAGLLALVVLICEGLSVPVTSELFTGRLDWTAVEFSRAKAIWGTAGMLLGALGGGFLADRFGTKRMAAFGIVITTVTYLTFALTSAHWASPGYPLAGYFLLLETGLALTTVSLFAMFMSISWTTAAATQFTLYMTILNIGAAIGPRLTEIGLGYRASFLLCAALAASPLLVLPFLQPARVAALKRAAASG